MVNISPLAGTTVYTGSYSFLTSTAGGVGGSNLSLASSTISGSGGATYTLALNTSGGTAEVLVISAGSTSSSNGTWNIAGGGSWNLPTNWYPAGVPNKAGAGAVINASTTSATTITLDAPQTVGTLLLGNSASAGTGYTISGSNTLTLDNSGITATITVANGTHAISAPVEIAGGSLAVALSNSGVLRISGNISDDNRGIADAGRRRQRAVDPQRQRQLRRRNEY